MDTGGAIIGIAAIGIGAMIGYGAYKDVPVFGPTGLLTGAISTGKIQKAPPKPNASTTTTPPATTPGPSILSRITSIPDNILKGLLP